MAWTTGPITTDNETDYPLQLAPGHNEDRAKVKGFADAAAEAASGIVDAFEAEGRTVETVEISGFGDRGNTEAIVVTVTTKKTAATAAEVAPPEPTGRTEELTPTAVDTGERDSDGESIFVNAAGERVYQDGEPWITR